MKKLTEILKGSKQNFLSLSLKQQDASDTVDFYVNKTKGTVVCRLWDRWYGLYHTAKAQCLDTDKFNEKRGRAIAFNRARQKELQHNLDMIAQERAWYEQHYKEAMDRLDKREHINNIYLEGVKLELEDLTK